MINYAIAFLAGSMFGAFVFAFVLALFKISQDVREGDYRDKKD